MFPNVGSLWHGQDLHAVANFLSATKAKFFLPAERPLADDFTSPDVTVKMIKSGTADFIGRARPSIADPFLPKKVEEGRIEDIRECIGCNICITGDMTMSISRCPQNPTFMEEWRKGWHPERMQAKGDSVLIVGAGLAGLEAARALGLRGYQVPIAEARTELGRPRGARTPGTSSS